MFFTKVFAILMLLSFTPPVSFAVLSREEEEAKTAKYLEFPSTLLIDLIQDYRTLESSQSHSESLPINLIHKLRTKLPEGAFEELYGDDFEEIRISQGELDVIRTFISFEAIHQGTQEMTEAFIPLEGESLEKYQRRILGKDRAKIEEIIKHHEMSDGLFKRDILEVFHSNYKKGSYESGVENYLNAFLGSMISSYLHAKFGSESSLIESYFSQAGFHSKRCPFFKSTLFQNWHTKALHGKVSDKASGKCAVADDVEESDSPSPLQSLLTHEIAKLTKTEATKLKKFDSKRRLAFFKRKIKASIAADETAYALLSGGKIYFFQDRTRFDNFLKTSSGFGNPSFDYRKKYNSEKSERDFLEKNLVFFDDQLNDLLIAKYGR